MRQLTFVKKGVLEWRDAAEPVLRSPAEAIVRPFVAARCDGDNLPLFNSASRLLQLGMALHLVDPITREALGDPPLKGPYAFGHECVAEVIECAPQVKSVKARGRRDRPAGTTRQRRFWSARPKWWWPASASRGRYNSSHRHRSKRFLFTR